MIDRDNLEFVIFCIENLADKLGCSGAQVYAYLSDRSNILTDYVAPNSDILHTQGKEYIVNDILGVMTKEGLLK